MVPMQAVGPFDFPARRDRIPQGAALSGHEGIRMLTSPTFHHLHLNSVDPEAAIDFYTRQFPSTSKTMWGEEPALASPNDVLILFTKVPRAPL